MEQVTSPRPPRRRHFVLDPLAFRRAIIPAAARGQIGQRLDRRLGVAEAAQKLVAMLEAAKESSALIESIANASRDQASSIEEVNSAVRQLDEMTQHNAALVEETNAAIEQTEAQASELDRIVDVFAIDGGTQKPQRRRAA